MTATIAMVAKRLSSSGPLAVLVACTLGACSHPQRPYVFDPSMDADRSTALLADLLASQGRPPAYVDPRTGILLTEWTDTGYRFHESDPHDSDHVLVEKDVYRRYHLAIVPVAMGQTSSVRVEAEAMLCMPDVIVQNHQLLGDCRPIAHFFRGLQADLDTFGARLRELSSLHATHAPKSVMAADSSASSPTAHVSEVAPR